MMKHIHALARLAAIAAVVVSASLAAAKDMRFPDKGEVAFVLHIPDAWNATPDGSGNLILKSPDKSSGLSLSVTEDKEAAVLPRDDWAKAVLSSAHAEPFSKHEPAAIGTIKAEAYYSRLMNDKKVNTHLKVMIVKVAQTHVVTMTIITAPNLSAAQQKSLDAVVKGITLTGIK